MMMTIPIDRQLDHLFVFFPSPPPPHPRQQTNIMYERTSTERWRSVERERRRREQWRQRRVDFVNQTPTFVRFVVRSRPIYSFRLRNHAFVNSFVVFSKTKQTTTKNAKSNEHAWRRWRRRTRCVERHERSVDQRNRVFVCLFLLWRISRCCCFLTW